MSYKAENEILFTRTMHDPPIRVKTGPVDEAKHAFPGDFLTSLQESLSSIHYLFLSSGASPLNETLNHVEAKYEEKDSQSTFG